MQKSSRNIPKASGRFSGTSQKLLGDFPAQQLLAISLESRRDGRASSVVEKAHTMEEMLDELFNSNFLDACLLPGSNQSIGDGLQLSDGSPSGVSFNYSSSSAPSSDDVRLRLEMDDNDNAASDHDVPLCPRCSRAFSLAAERIPKTLPCQHLVCLNCICEAMQGTEVACTECGVRHSLSAAGAGTGGRALAGLLPTNILIVEMLKIISQQRPAHQVKTSASQSSGINLTSMHGGPSLTSVQTAPDPAAADASPRSDLQKLDNFALYDGDDFACDDDTSCISSKHFMRITKLKTNRATASKSSPPSAHNEGKAENMRGGRVYHLLSETQGESESVSPAPDSAKRVHHLPKCDASCTCVPTLPPESGSANSTQAGSANSTKAGSANSTKAAQKGEDKKFQKGAQTQAIAEVEGRAQDDEQSVRSNGNQNQQQKRGANVQSQDEEEREDEDASLLDLPLNRLLLRSNMAPATAAASLSSTSPPSAPLAAKALTDDNDDLTLAQRRERLSPLKSSAAAPVTVDDDDDLTFAQRRQRMNTTTVLKQQKDCVHSGHLQVSAPGGARELGSIETVVGASRGRGRDVGRGKGRGEGSVFGEGNVEHSKKEKETGRDLKAIVSKGVNVQTLQSNRPQRQRKQVERIKSSQLRSVDLGSHTISAHNVSAAKPLEDAGGSEKQMTQAATAEQKRDKKKTGKKEKEKELERSEMPLKKMEMMRQHLHNPQKPADGACEQEQMAEGVKVFKMQVFTHIANPLAAAEHANASEQQMAQGEMEGREGREENECGGAQANVVISLEDREQLLVKLDQGLSPSSGGSLKKKGRRKRSRGKIVNFDVAHLTPKKDLADTLDSASDFPSIYPVSAKKLPNKISNVADAASATKTPRGERGILKSEEKESSGKLCALGTLAARDTGKARRWGLAGGRFGKTMVFKSSAASLSAASVLRDTAISSSLSAGSASTHTSASAATRHVGIVEQSVLAASATTENVVLKDASAEEAIEQHLPQGWIQCWSKTKKRPYFRHFASERSTWARPIHTCGEDAVDFEEGQVTEGYAADVDSLTEAGDGGSQESLGSQADTAALPSHVESTFVLHCESTSGGVGSGSKQHTVNVGLGGNDVADAGIRTPAITPAIALAPAQTETLLGRLSRASAGSRIQDHDDACEGSSVAKKRKLDRPRTQPFEPEQHKEAEQAQEVSGEKKDKAMTRRGEEIREEDDNKFQEESQEEKAGKKKKEKELERLEMPLKKKKTTHLHNSQPSAGAGEQEPMAEGVEASKMQVFTHIANPLVAAEDANASEQQIAQGEMARRRGNGVHRQIGVEGLCGRVVSGIVMESDQVFAMPAYMKRDKVSARKPSGILDEQRWNDHFTTLLAYQETFGHTCPPRTRSCPTIGSTNEFAQWVANQVHLLHRRNVCVHAHA